MTVSLKRIDVAVLFVDDLERSKVFYQDTLGFPLTFVREPVHRAWGMRTAHFRDPHGNLGRSRAIDAESRVEEEVDG